MKKLLADGNVLALSKAEDSLKKVEFKLVGAIIRYLFSNVSLTAIKYVCFFSNVSLTAIKYVCFLQNEFRVEIENHKNENLHVVCAYIVFNHRESYGVHFKV